MGKKGKDLYWVKRAAQRIKFLCIEEAEENETIPRTSDLEEIIRESYEAKGD